MYADDTNSLFLGTAFATLNIKNWLLSTNKLTLNVTKTEYMLIASKYRLENIPTSPQLQIYSTPIRVQKSESVGVWIDSTPIRVQKSESVGVWIDSTPTRVQKSESVGVWIDSTPIRVQKSESVGVWIDEKLIWSENIDSVAKKISRAIGGLRQIGPLVAFHTLLMI